MADYIRPTPRNPALGLLADALMGGVEWMRSPQRAQQMQGLGGLLADTGIPAVVDRMSYGEPLTTGRGMTTRLRPEAEAALMTLGPEAVPIGRGAMAAVRATKGMPVGAATVYHGSPYRFQRFDPTKIGSGEGAQAYGYGHYVAQAQDVAKEYANMPKFKQGVIENPEVLGRGAKDFINRVEKFGSIDKARQEAQELLAAMRKQNSFPAVQDQLATEIDLANRYGSQLQVKPTGVSPQLYTIDLPDPAIARMLDWDKPLRSQSAEIRQAVSPLIESAAKAYPYIKENQSMTGAGLIGAYKGYRGGNAQATSEALRAAGIPGVRYLDQGSRGTGAGTSNFVVFPGEENLLRILSVNGGLLAP